MCAISKSPNRYQPLSAITFAICVSIRYGIIDYPRQRKVKTKADVTEMLRHYVPLHDKLDEYLSSKALRRTNDYMFIDAP